MPTVRPLMPSASPATAALASCPRGGVGSVSRTTR
jgi:hypothetical protein